MRKPLIEKLDITHFRGVNELSLDNLSCVNVLAGANNCGKTSVLEALTLLGAPDSFRTVTEMALYRISPSEQQESEHRIEYIRSMFYEVGKLKGRYVIDLGIKLNLGAMSNDVYRRYRISGNLDKPSGSFQRTGEVLHLSATNDKQLWGDALWEVDVRDGVDFGFLEKKKPLFRSGEKDYQAKKIDDENDTGYYSHSKEPNTFDTFYLPASQVNYYRIGAKLMFNILRDGKKRDILEVMQIFAPHVEGFYIPWEEDLYLEQKDGSLLPLYAYGYGMQKAVALASVTLNMENGVLLIDEIENSVHMSAFEEVFRWFIEACLQYRVQVFLTTHSAEALDAILQVVHDHFQEQDVLRVITLRKDMEANLTRKIVRTGEEAYQDRELYKEELRV